MFEIIATYRPDFVERVLDRFKNLEEARAAAERLSTEYHNEIIRVWVRQVRVAKTQM